MPGRTRKTQIKCEQIDAPPLKQTQSEYSDCRERNPQSFERSLAASAAISSQVPVAVKHHGSRWLVGGSEGVSFSQCAGADGLGCVGNVGLGQRRGDGWRQPPWQLLSARLGPEVEGPWMGSGLPRRRLWVQTLHVLLCCR